MRTKAQQQGIDYENFVYNNLCKEFPHNTILRESQIARRYKKIKKFDFLIYDVKNGTNVLIQCKHYKFKLPENDVLGIIKKYEDIVVELKHTDNIIPSNCIAIIDTNYGLTSNGYSQIKNYNQKLCDIYNSDNINFIQCTAPIYKKDMMCQYENLIDTINLGTKHKINKRHLTRNNISNNCDKYKYNANDSNCIYYTNNAYKNDIIYFNVNTIKNPINIRCIIDKYEIKLKQYKNRIVSLEYKLDSKRTVIEQQQEKIRHKNELINNLNKLVDKKNKSHDNNIIEGPIEPKRKTNCIFQ